MMIKQLERKELYRGNYIVNLREINIIIVFQGMKDYYFDNDDRLFFIFK